MYWNSLLRLLSHRPENPAIIGWPGFLNELIVCACVRACAPARLKYQSWKHNFCLLILNTGLSILATFCSVRSCSLQCYQFSFCTRVEFRNSIQFLSGIKQNYWVQSSIEACPTKWCPCSVFIKSLYGFAMLPILSLACHDVTTTLSFCGVVSLRVVRWLGFVKLRCRSILLDWVSLQEHCYLI